MNNYKVYSGMPYQYKAVKEKYYDKSGFGTITSDASVDVVMEEYPGLTVQTVEKNNVMMIDIAGGELPDHSTFDGITGVLETSGNYLVTNITAPGLLGEGLADSPTEQTYEIYYKDGSITLYKSLMPAAGQWVGKVTVPAHEVVSLEKVHFSIEGEVNVENDVADGFSSTSWIVSTVAAPNELVVAGSLRFLSRVKAVTGSTEAILADYVGHMCGITGTYWRIWDTGSRTGGTVTDGTWYWVQVVFTATSTILYAFEDDGTSGAPSVINEKWVKKVSAGFSMTPGLIHIGCNPNSTTEYWRGSIDLERTNLKYKAEGSNVWHMIWRATDGAFENEMELDV